jgi:hypothetical protein
MKADDDQIKVLVFGHLQGQSGLRDLGDQVARFDPAAASDAQATGLELEDIGAGILVAWMHELFEQHPSDILWESAMGRVQRYADLESRTGGRAWGLVRAMLLEIGTAQGWTGLPTDPARPTPRVAPPLSAAVADRAGGERTPAPAGGRRASAGPTTWLIAIGAVAVVAAGWFAMGDPGMPLNDGDYGCSLEGAVTLRSGPGATVENGEVVDVWDFDMRTGTKTSLPFRDARQTGPKEFKVTSAVPGIGSDQTSSYVCTQD